MDKKDQSAFPEPFVNDPHLAISHTKGLTKREYFAISALNGILSDHTFDEIPDDAAKIAIGYADALLKQLEITQNNQQNEAR